MRIKNKFLLVLVPFVLRLWHHYFVLLSLWAETAADCPSFLWPVDPGRFSGGRSRSCRCRAGRLLPRCLSRWDGKLSWNRRKRWSGGPEGAREEQKQRHRPSGETQISRKWKTCGGVRNKEPWLTAVCRRSLMTSSNYFRTSMLMLLFQNIKLYFREYVKLKKNKNTS